MYELAAARLHTLLVTQKKAMYSQQKTDSKRPNNKRNRDCEASRIHDSESAQGAKEQEQQRTPGKQGP